MSEPARAFRWIRRRCSFTGWRRGRGTLLFLHNLGPSNVLVDVGPQPGRKGEPVEMFSDRAYDAAGPELDSLAVAGHGYRWLRLRRTA